MIVRNTMINDVWGSEERAAPSFPFVPGQPFEVGIIFEYADILWFNPAHIGGFLQFIAFFGIVLMFADIFCNLFCKLRSTFSLHF